MESKTFSKDTFKKMTGAELTQDWLDSDPTAMTEPIIIEEPDGLGMTMPQIGRASCRERVSSKV